MKEADHEETAPDAEMPIISKLTCSLKGQMETLRILPGTVAHAAYQTESSLENFLCNYGVNPRYQDQILRDPLRVSGVGPEGEARIIELPAFRFYLATLFVPQLNSSSEAPHPLILRFVESALK